MCLTADYVFQKLKAEFQKNPTKQLHNQIEDKTRIMKKLQEELFTLNGVPSDTQVGVTSLPAQLGCHLSYVAQVGVMSLCGTGRLSYLLPDTGRLSNLLRGTGRQSYLLHGTGRQSNFLHGTCRQ